LTINTIRKITLEELGDARGNLVVIEGGTDIPFEIKRVFYIYDSDPDVVRGRHANRVSEFVLINLCGSCKVWASDATHDEVFVLNKPNEGIYLPCMIWKEMYDFSADSLLLALSNERYDSGEYIRDFEQYKEIVTMIGGI